MGAPTSEVGYTSATARRGDHESSYEHVVALEKKKYAKPERMHVQNTYSTSIHNSAFVLFALNFD